MDSEKNGPDIKVPHGPDPSSTLLPMLIVGLVLITISMVLVMIFA